MADAKATATSGVPQPAPLPNAASEIKHLTKHQRFDVTAFVKNVGQPRNVTENSSVVDIIILRENEGKGKALSFFALDGKKLTEVS